MIADALQAEMISEAARARRENVLLLRAAQGKLDAHQVAHYLANVRRVLENTPVFLARAGARAQALGKRALAEFFAHKDEEEEGHAEWAKHDIATLSARAPNPKSDIVPATQEFIDLTWALADEDPELLLAYIFFNENLVVLLGDEALSNLEEHCGTPRSSVTAIDYHITLDRDHVDEALATIDRLVSDPQKLPRMRTIVRDCFAIFDRFGAQIAETNHERSATYAAAHAPAA